MRLPDGRYPLVCQLETGRGSPPVRQLPWPLGEQVHLDRFLQSYAVEMTRLEARRKGHSVTEQQLQDGSVKLTINVGAASGGAA